MEKSPTVSIIGLGYVGLSTAACFASRGFQVLGMDVDKRRLDILRRGDSPIHEKGLAPLLRHALKNEALILASDYDGIADSPCIFITVGTPSRDDGSIDTKYVASASEAIGKELRRTDGYRLVVVKSTVIPGTTEGLVLPTLQGQSGKKAGPGFGLASNPEFLHEGSAVEETFRPDALLVGGHDKRSSDTLLRLYRKFYGKLPQTIVTTPSNAEMMKYAINAGRASQLSFVNTIANLCTRVPGCDYDEVRKGLLTVAKMDPRYLNAGLGFGGSCVPPYTRVVTNSGFKPISSLQVGDKVLSHDGIYHEVTRTFRREYDGMMYLFRSQGFTSTPLLVTPEHPIFASVRNSGGLSRFYHTDIPGRGVVQKLKNYYLVEPPDFLDPAGLSQGDFMVLPAFNEGSDSVPRLELASSRRHYSLVLCPDLMFLFGLWLAEGSVDTRRGEVLFSFNSNERRFLREIDRICHKYFGVKASVKKSSSKGNSLAVRVKCMALALFLERTFGRGADRKHVPWEWLGLPSGLLVSLIRGIWYGDGSNRSTEEYHRFTYATTSIELADFMEMALLKLRAPYRRRMSRERTSKDGVHHKPAHYLYGVDNSIMNGLLPELKVAPVAQAHKTSWFEGNYFIFPIKATEVVRYKGTVHNLEVDGTNSYAVAGATLHNCLPKDSRALASFSGSLGVDGRMVASALDINEEQPEEAVKMAEKFLGSLAGKKVSVLGLSFKAGSDDTRESVAISLARRLAGKGASVSVYDPVATENAKNLLGSTVNYADRVRDCLRGSECAFVATGWDEFKRLRPADFKSLMASPVLIDGRRIYETDAFRKAGIKIATLGTGPHLGG